MADREPISTLSWRQRLRRSWWQISIRLSALDLARARLLRDKPSIVDDLIDIGRRRLQLRTFEPAQTTLSEAHDLAVKIGYEVGVARAQIHAAEVAHWRGDADLVVELVDAELPRIRRLGADIRLAYVLCILGEALVAQERLPAAAEAFIEAQRVAERRGDWQQKAYAVYGMGSVAYHDDRLADAFEDWTAAMEIYRRHRDFGGVAHMQHWLSIAAAEQRRVAESRQFAVASIQNYEKAGHPDIAQRARRHLTEIDEFISDGGFRTSDDQP